MTEQTKEPIHIISLGAGVQSSTMALMAAHGEITPMPSCAVFANVGDRNEPDEVYEWLEKLKGWLPFPVYVVSEGNLKDHVYAAVANQRRLANPPLFVSSDNGGGVLSRDCTADFKVRPLKKFARRIHLDTGKPIIQWIGISLDEVHRMKDSRVQYISHRWPLVENRMTRHDCLLWLEKRGYPKAPRSACWFCPYTSDARWRERKMNRPDEWARAVDFDKTIRRGVNKVKGECFLHKSMKPLDEVDFSNDIDNGQVELGFGNECEGMCGV